MSEASAIEQVLQRIERGSRDFIDTDLEDAGGRFIYADDLKALIACARALKEISTVSEMRRLAREGIAKLVVLK